MESVTHCALTIASLATLLVASGCATPDRPDKPRPIEVSLGTVQQVQLPPLPDGISLVAWGADCPHGLGFESKTKTFYFGCRGSLWSAPEGTSVAVRIPTDREKSIWLGSPWA